MGYGDTYTRQAKTKTRCVSFSRSQYSKKRGFFLRKIQIYRWKPREMSLIFFNTTLECQKDMYAYGHWVFNLFNLVVIKRIFI